jgi:hypothetical protein
MCDWFPELVPGSRGYWYRFPTFRWEPGTTAAGTGSQDTRRTLPGLRSIAAGSYPVVSS